MKYYKLTDSELKFTELVWEHQPITSGELVKLCERAFLWKKSTTYTVLKKLCDNNILQNENAVVTARLTKDNYFANQTTRFVEDTFGGSLPKFLTAFIGNNKLTKKEAEELKKLIDDYNDKA